MIRGVSRDRPLTPSPCTSFRCGSFPIPPGSSLATSSWISILSLMLVSWLWWQADSTNTRTSVRSAFNNPRLLAFVAGRLPAAARRTLPDAPVPALVALPEATTVTIEGGQRLSVGDAARLGILAVLP